jgi:hypothetical protein
MSQDSVDYTMDGPSGVLFLTGMGDFLFFSFFFFIMSRPTLGLTQPPIQWVLGVLPLGGKAAGL